MHSLRPQETRTHTLGRQAGRRGTPERSEKPPDINGKLSNRTPDVKEGADWPTKTRAPPRETHFTNTAGDILTSNQHSERPSPSSCEFAFQSKGKHERESDAIVLKRCLQRSVGLKEILILQL